MCYCVLYLMLSLPHLYWHIQHGISMLIFHKRNTKMFVAMEVMVEVVIEKASTAASISLVYVRYNFGTFFFFFGWSFVNVNQIQN